MEEFLAQYWQLLIPIVLIDFVLKIVAVIDLFRREQVAGGKKWLWAIILAINYFGPVIYLVLGRKE
jgi:hypothetical protein